MPHYRVPNESSPHFLDEGDDPIKWLPQGAAQITDEEAETMRIALLPVPTYQELRAAAYPSFADQFDLLYHGGVDAWKAAITAIKEEFPK